MNGNANKLIALIAATALLFASNSVRPVRVDPMQSITTTPCK